MRLKTFSAATMQEVMTQVRAALGPDAIIVSSHQGKGGGPVKVVAAVEATARPEPPKPVAEPARQPAQAKAARPAQPASQPALSIQSILDHHGVPRAVGGRLDKTARSIDAESAHMALAGAIDTAYGFIPLASTQARPLLLAGAPGAGKTSSIAKLAARAALEGKRVGLVTTDTVRSGGIEQLTGYADLLDLEVKIANTPGELTGTVSALRREKPDLILVDTAGINPFAADDLTVRPVLVQDGNFLIGLYAGIFQQLEGRRREIGLIEEEVPGISPLVGGFKRLERRTRRHERNFASFCDERSCVDEWRRTGAKDGDRTIATD